MHFLCLCIFITLWVLQMSLQSFDADTLTEKNTSENEEAGSMHVSILSIFIFVLMWVTVSRGLEKNRWGISWVSNVIWFFWVSHYTVSEEKRHQSPCPPTLSLGMMRSSEPCFRNTFPVTQDRDLCENHRRYLHAFLSLLLRCCKHGHFKLKENLNFLSQKTKLEWNLKKKLNV